MSNQRSRWGSCTPADGSIRLSDRLRGMPSYVVDYVILHELAHLLVAGHNRDFWTLLRSYPRLERARGFLDGVALAKGLDIADDVDDGRTSRTRPPEPAPRQRSQRPAGRARRGPKLGPRACGEARRTGHHATSSDSSLVAGVDVAVEHRGVAHVEVRPTPPEVPAQACAGRAGRRPARASPTRMPDSSRASRVAAASRLASAASR